MEITSFLILRVHSLEKQKLMGDWPRISDPSHDQKAANRNREEIILMRDGISSQLFKVICLSGKRLLLWNLNSS
jgi:hypothetical protein